MLLPREGPLRGLIEPAARVHVSPFNPWMSLGAPVRQRLRWGVHDLVRAVPRVAKHISTVAPDVVVTSTITIPVGALAARRAGVPHVWSIHEFGRDDHGAQFHLGERASLSVIERLSAMVFVNSPAVRAHFRARLSKSSLRLIPYAVELPGEVERSWPGSGPLQLVLLGARSPTKGQANAIEAVATLVRGGADVELTLVGSGTADYDAILRRRANSLGVADRVRFLDFQPNPYSELGAAHIGLMCSRMEAFGRVTVEAMKLEKPVVGSASGGTRDLIRHGWNGTPVRGRQSRGPRASGLAAVPRSRKCTCYGPTRKRVGASELQHGVHGPRARDRVTGRDWLACPSDGVRSASPGRSRVKSRVGIRV